MPAVRALLQKPAVALGLIGVIALLPSFLFGPGATHSHLYNMMWTQHFGQQMAAGHFYERWLPASFEGMGSPAFYFYPPFAYWLTGGLHALGLTVFQAINIAGLLLVVASGLSMHAWLSHRGTHPLPGAALYMLAPYHLYDFHVRGALAEFAAFVWLPLIALAIERLPQRRGLLLLALSYGALVITHLPLAMLTGIFLITPMMLRKAWHDPACLLPGAFAGLIALGLSAFYLLPALTLQEHISTAILWSKDYKATDWSIWDASFEMFPCLALVLIILAWPARSFWTVVTVIAALASIRLIPFLWDIAMLNKAQFPWRVMGIAEFAAVTALMSYRPRGLFLAAAGLLLLFPYAFGALLTQANLRKHVDYGLIARVMPDAPEYLPRGFDLSLVREKDHWTDLRRFRALPEGQEIRVDRAQRVTLHHAAFPIWRVIHDGAPVPSSGPLISFDAQPGLYRIERVTLWQERLGFAITLLAALLLLLSQLRVASVRRAISHLSKFPSYSPLPATTDPSHSGGEL